MLWIGLSTIQSSFSQRLCALCERPESSNSLKLVSEKTSIRAQSFLSHFLTKNSCKGEIKLLERDLGSSPSMI